MHARRKLTIPLVLAVSVSAVGCGRIESPDAGPDVASTDSGTDSGERACEPVLDLAAAVQPTYRCRDGRACSDVRPEQSDGGVYQVCPGTDGCATLVMSNGQSMVGFC